MIQILKRPAGNQGSYSLVNSGNSNANGQFEIIIQPSDSEFQNTYEFIASASVNVNGIATQKVSSANTYAFNITSRLINITSPINNSVIHQPKITLKGSTASPNVSLQMYYTSNNTPTGNSFNSDGNGSFNQDIPFYQDGTFPFKLSGIINSLRTTSNTTTLTFDIYKPIIAAPLSGTIKTPTFNIIGTSAPSTRVDILKRSIGGTFEFISSKNTGVDGAFDITIQPSPHEYNQTFEFIASASVVVNGITTIKQSSIFTYEFAIPDYPPIISSPLTNTTIYSPTFQISGTSTKNTLINIFENGTITKNTTTNSTGIFNKTLTTPFSKNKINRTYKVSANIYEIPRESSPIILYFDLYKPRIFDPPNNTTITTPTFNIFGNTKPNNSVHIFRRESGQTTYEFIKSETTNANGTFNITIQPTHIDYQKTFEYIASASVTEGGITHSKTSTINTVQFNIKDYPTTLMATHANDIIYSPTFNLQGTTKAGNQLSILENNSITNNGIANIGTEQNGFRSFEIIMTSPKQIPYKHFNIKQRQIFMNYPESPTLFH